MNDETPPRELVPVLAEAPIIRARSAELLPQRRHHRMLMGGLTAGAGLLIAASAAAGSPWPVALFGPLLATGTLAVFRAERRAGIGAFKAIPLMEAVVPLPDGARLRLHGRVVGPFAHVRPTNDGDEAEQVTATTALAVHKSVEMAVRQETPVLTLASARAADASALPTAELRGHDFLITSQSGEKVAVLVDGAFLFVAEAAEQTAHARLQPVSVNAGDLVEIVGTLGRLVHPDGQRVSPRSPMLLPALHSTRRHPLLVRKLG